MEEKFDASSSLEKENISVDKEDFACVNYEEENTGEKIKGKKPLNKKTLVIGAVFVILALLLGFFAKSFYLNLLDNKGICNMYNSSIGVVKDGILYHSSLDGTKFLKTNIDNGEQEIISKQGVAFISEYKNKIYYFDSLAEKFYRYSEDGEHKLIYDGATYYPCFYGNYLYFMTPESNYGGFVRRVPLSGGEEEVVLNVPCSSFQIVSGNIVYYDPAISSILTVKLSDAKKFAKDSGNEAVTSSDIKAIELLGNISASNINVKGDYIYFCNNGDEYTLTSLNLKNGEVKEINYGTQGLYLNVCEEQMYYVSVADNHIYRCNLDGKDIRDLTGNDYAQVAGIGISDGYIVYYAIAGSYDENMQIQYTPVIAVSKTDGTRICELPQTFDYSESENFIVE